MPFFEGLELLEEARSAENEEKMFFRWVVGYQSQMSFDVFKQKINRETEDDSSEEEIFDKVRRIIG